MAHGKYGKIARLPREIREQLNQRLADGEPGRRLVDWLNGLPAVQAMLAGAFGGRGINEQNLTNWRQGGYRYWELAREIQEGTGNERAMRSYEQRYAALEADENMTGLESIGPNQGESFVHNQQSEKEDEEEWLTTERHENSESLVANPAMGEVIMKADWGELGWIGLNQGERKAPRLVSGSGDGPSPLRGGVRMGVHGTEWESIGVNQGEIIFRGGQCGKEGKAKGQRLKAEKSARSRRSMGLISQGNMELESSVHRQAGKPARHDETRRLEAGAPETGESSFRLPNPCSHTSILANALASSGKHFSWP